MRRGGLPADGFRSFLKYLTLPELCVLDLAILNHEMRSQYLLALSGMIVKDLEILFTTRLLQWLLQRKMLVRHIHKPFPGDLMQRLICSSQQTLQSLTISSPKLLPSLLIHFPNLTSFNLSNCQKIHQESFQQFLLLNPKIERLALSNVSRLSLSTIGNLQNLSDLDLSSNQWITNEALWSLCEGCLTLLAVNIRDTGIDSEDSIESFLSAHPNLHYFGFDSFMFETLSPLILRSVILNSLSSDCPKRQLLGLRNCYEIFSEGTSPFTSRDENHLSGVEESDVTELMNDNFISLFLKFLSSNHSSVCSFPH